MVGNFSCFDIFFKINIFIELIQCHIVCLKSSAAQICLTLLTYVCVEVGDSPLDFFVP